MMTGRPLPALIAASLLALVMAGSASAAPDGESFHYRWRLRSFLGRIAGLFFPSQGDGVLSFETNAQGNLISRLEVTSEKTDDGEFWRYGAEVDTARKRTLRAWSSYRFRGEGKERSESVEEAGVIDIAYGIYRIRAAPPKNRQRVSIWSDGRIYPVDILPQGSDTRKVGGRRIPTHHFLIKGAQVPNQRFWKGSLELWLAEDAAATPVAILIRRSGVGVLLELADLPRENKKQN